MLVSCVLVSDDPCRVFIPEKYVGTSLDATLNSEVSIYLKILKQQGSRIGLDGVPFLVDVYAPAKINRGDFITFANIKLHVTQTNVDVYT